MARMGDRRGSYKVLVGKPEGKRPLVRPRHSWDDNTRVVPKVMSNVSFFFFFACELGRADEGECGGRWNQLLCYS